MRIDKLTLHKVGPFESAEIVFEKGTDPNLADVYLLTGPNGSGKSTALYSIASLIGSKNLGPALGCQRLRTAESFAIVSTDGKPRHGMMWGHAAGMYNQAIHGEFSRRLPDPSAFSDIGHVHFFSSGSGLGELPYAYYGRQFDAMEPADARRNFSWAVFAYAGTRSLENGRAEAVKEPNENPFLNSLSFLATTESSQLFEWIVSQNYKRLLAKDAGDSKASQNLERSVRDIERVIAEIIGEEFSFHINGLDVQARVGGAGRSPISLGLLPDGLKSIISWVADLLMRLDRIPWVDDTPPMKRKFLLLLDEIDIHLHPAWQRRVLPFVQKLFPKAQIIASTHSPFVVASAADAKIIQLKVEDGVASVAHTLPSQIGSSYISVLRSVFGIDSEFDVETEGLFAKFYEERDRLLSGVASEVSAMDELGEELSARGEEVADIVAIELRQVRRQLGQRDAAATGKAA